ncbi:lytic transglycosylase domain-containing protein [Amycolatopsis speibonae]|uniref:Lytic transglycosylase domain-containing protein n=1 Tax=Amycolatopsis speibonae TaxID=1450224 RepID=A0ABV7P8P3_9PSEU
MTVLRRRRVSAACLLAVLLAGCGGPNDPRPSVTGATTAPVTAVDGDYDPARFATQVKARAAEAAVSPRLVMAILYNESYKPHDPELERQWQELKPNASFGVANMHKAAYEQTRRGRAFADRAWRELPDDSDLAIRAEAWYLHDLAAQLPGKRAGTLTTEELLALGYNTGPGNMKAFARGTKPGIQAQSYLDTLHANWGKAEEALKPG